MGAPVMAYEDGWFQATEEDDFSTEALMDEMDSEEFEEDFEDSDELDQDQEED